MGIPDPFLVNSIAEFIVKVAGTILVVGGALVAAVTVWMLVGSIFGRGKKK